MGCENMKLKKIIEIILIMLMFYFMSFISLSNISPYLSLILIIILYQYTKNFKNNNRITIISLIFSLMFTIGNLDINKFNFNELIILIIEYLGWYYILRRLFYLLEKNYHKINLDSQNKEISMKKFIGISMIIGFLFYLPYLLKLYPGVVSYDSYEQLSQIVGNLSYSNHHPVLHTLIIKLFYDLGNLLTGNSNIGLLLYTIFQMVVACFTFSFTTYTLYKNNINKYVVVFIWLFFFITPYNAIYSVTIWKDILFSYIVLLTTILLWNHYHNKLEWNNKNKVIFIFLSILICLLRSNGFYAYIIFVILFYLLYKKEFKKIFIPIIISLFVVVIFKYPVLSLLKVKQPDFVESISIPLQQVGYVIRKDGNITDEELNLISKIADIEKIKNDVTHFHISNPIKDNIRDHDINHYLESHKLDYLKLWINLGIKNIKLYKDAYVLQTSGYYYHNYGRYWVYLKDFQNDGYAGKLDIERHELLPETYSRFIDLKLEINDFIHYNFGSLAISLYLILISLFITINKKGNILIYIIPLSIFITLLIATPVACEFRYVYSLYLTAPVFLIMSLKRGEVNEK